jgi:hypothetical protein
LKEAVEIFNTTVDSPLSNVLSHLGKVARTALKFADNAGPIGTVLAGTAKLIFEVRTLFASQT